MTYLFIFYCEFSDAYLCVGNMTMPLANHQMRALELGWEMIQYVQRFLVERGYDVNLRIGINCGPIFGIVVIFKQCN